MADTGFCRVKDYCYYKNFKSPNYISDGKESTYAYEQYGDSPSSYSNIAREIVYKMSFPGITDVSKIRITGFKIQALARSNGTTASSIKNSFLGVFLVKDFYIGHSNDDPRSRMTIIDGSDSTQPHLLFGTKDGNSSGGGSTATWFEYSVTDPNNADLIYIQNNISEIIAETIGNRFGIYVEGTYVRVYELGMILYYEETSKIYVGSARTSAVYVGGTKASAVYIGNTKIL